MSKIGGYQILDLGGVELSGSAVTIKGAYETIKNANGKAILVSGANFGGTQVADTFACAIPGENKYSFIVCGNQFEVANTDEVKTVAYDGAGTIPTITAYGQYGLAKIVDTTNVIGGKSLRIVTQGANKGAITINSLAKIEALAPDADVATVVTAFNAMLADMKDKTIMIK